MLWHEIMVVTSIGSVGKHCSRDTLLYTTYKWYRETEHSEAFDGRMRSLSPLFETGKKIPIVFIYLICILDVRILFV